MKIILLQNVDGLGKKYEIKEAKPGYARNFLIPEGLAKLATKENVKWLQSQKEAFEKEIEEDLKKTQEVASRIDGIEVPITVKLGEKGELFESINNIKIAEKLKEMGFDVKKSQINLKLPIKEAGEYPIKINFDHNLEVEIKVIVTGEAVPEEKV